MQKWIVATILILGAHFGASYMVPLDQKAQGEFAGLLKWFWPWADGDSGPLGVMTVSSGFPMSGYFVAVTSAGFFFIAALAVAGIWVPSHWWRFCAGVGAILSVFLMIMFFGPTKLAPVALDVFVLWSVRTNWAPAVRQP